MKEILNQVKEAFKLSANNQKSTNSLIKSQNWVRPLLIILATSFLANIFGGIGLAILFLILTIIISFSSFAWLHMFYRFFGGKATYKQTLSLGLNIQLVPSIIFTGLTLIMIFSLYISSFLGAIFSYLAGVFLLCYLPWFIIIFTQTLSKAHKISLLKTYLAQIISLITFILLISLLVAILVQIFIPNYLDLITSQGVNFN